MAAQESEHGSGERMGRARIDKLPELGIDSPFESIELGFRRSFLTASRPDLDLDIDARKGNLRAEHKIFAEFPLGAREYRANPIEEIRLAHAEAAPEEDGEAALAGAQFADLRQDRMLEHRQALARHARQEMKGGLVNFHREAGRDSPAVRDHLRRRRQI